MGLKRNEQIVQIGLISGNGFYELKKMKVECDHNGNYLIPAYIYGKDGITKYWLFAHDKDKCFLKYRKE